MTKYGSMGKQDIIHVMHYDKFCEPFISFCEDVMEVERHFFFVFGEVSSSYKIINRPNVLVSRLEFSDVGSTLDLLKIAVEQSKRVFLHGLFHELVMRFFFENTKFLSKSAWCLWGGDLHAPTNVVDKINWDKKEIFRKEIIKNVGCIVSGIEGEYLIAKQRYGALGRFHKSLVYPNNLYSDISQPSYPSNMLNILLGNSASPENNHLPALDMIKPLWEGNATILCPLSYGDPKYAKTVSSYGKALFGSNFIVLDTFLDKEEYDELLCTIDIAIFNHNRQQAVSNMISLLGLGKKVFLRKSVTTFDYFSRQGIKVFDINHLNLEPDFSENEINRMIIRDNYSMAKLTDDLSVLFDLNYSLF